MQVFTTPPLIENLAITGPVDANIFVSSTAVDTDIVVKLSDVYPDGRSILLIDGVRRMRWRANQSVPSLLEPGDVYEASVSLTNTSYVFAKGHSIRVAVQGSNYPRFSVNMNHGLDLSREDELPGVVAENTIHFSSDYPSSITLPVVSLESMPEMDIFDAERSVAEALGWGEEKLAAVRLQLNSMVTNMTERFAINSTNKYM